MTANIGVPIARSDVVGSLLWPAYLRETRQGVCEGRVSEAELHAAADRAVREAIALQGAAKTASRVGIEPLDIRDA